MIEFIENFIENEDLIFGITDNKKLNLPKKLLQDTPFVNYSYDERTNPLATMKNCNSIIVVGMGYKLTTNSDKTKPYVASGYLDFDYPKILKEKLSSLVKKMTLEKNFDYKIFVDTGPLSERELAKKSGLGFYGKNHSIISKKFGSAFFIGYIMTDLKLPINLEINKDCGKCTKCINICHAKSLTDNNNKVNFKNFCSYITQKKEDLTESEKKLLDNKLYGCDDCLTVCPFNSEHHINTINPLEFDNIINLSNREFKEKFYNKGIFWRGNKVIKRNASIGKSTLYKHKK